MPTDPPTIVLIGPMGAGKTSIGRRLARALGVPFADSDKLIARAHGPIPEIFAAHGEAVFREREREVVAEALAQGGVLSLGGGAVLDEGTRSALHAHRVVLLTVSAEAVARRLSEGSRPLLEGGADPLAEWERIAREREPIYREVADVVFDTSHGPLSAVVEQIAEWVEEQG